MPNDSQYGRTLFIEDFTRASSAKALTRIHFSKNASEPSSYDEAWLQRLIMGQPSLLPVDQIEPAFAEMVPVCMELPTPSGFVDNLLVTPSGDLALIECKLWRNPEARRNVIAQIIDYAKDISSWSYEQLEDAINRAKPLDDSGVKTKQKLHELVSANADSDEAAFHDAVSRNLRRGRFLLLIIGDGIREGIESMTEFLQQYAGLHFILGIVELALFEIPIGGYIAQPRILARTTNIDRGIVTVDEQGRITIGPSSTTVAPPGTMGRKMTITKERYIEKLERQFPGIAERLNRFIDNLQNYNVSPEFGSDSMILRWRSDGARSWNMAQIASAGQVFTDIFGFQAQSAGLLDAYKQYVEKLAALIPGAIIKPSKKETAWGAYKDGKIITIDALLANQAREDGWLQAIKEFQATSAKSFQSA